MVLCIYIKVALKEPEPNIIAIQTFTIDRSLPDTTALPSAKPRKHSSNYLPSVTLDKEDSVNCTSVPFLSSTFCRPLGNN
jgi:hypothetical protein